MTPQEKVDYKNELLQVCIDILQERIAVATMAMENAQAAANMEEKSSAGDKYETSRAMSHLEKDMYARQLAANRLELAQLLIINCTRIYDTVANGSLVQCEGVSFFIAAGLGKVLSRGKDIFLLSGHAPMAISLMHKKPGEQIHFNGKVFRVLEVY